MLFNALPALIYLALVVYAVIDCLQTPADDLHRLSRTGWIAAIALIPVIGALGWLLAGRVGVSSARRHQRAPSGPVRADGYGWTAEGVAQHPIGPDDDPEFLAGLASLGRAQREQKRLLTRQEEDRRRRALEQHGDEADEPGND